MKHLKETNIEKKLFIVVLVVIVLVLFKFLTT